VKTFFKQYLNITIAFIITICLIRVYEYFFIAAHLFVNHPFLFELSGWLYDVWFGLIYTTIALVPAMLLALLHKKAGLVLSHVLNVTALILYISLLIVFLSVMFRLIMNSLPEAAKIPGLLPSRC